MRCALLIWMCLWAGEAGAQLTGVIVDPIAARRIPGAVVTLLDSARAVVRQSLADDSGRFHIENVGAARSIRVVKIGYRPVQLRIASGSIEIKMERLPNLLEPLRTSEQPRCSRDATRPAAFGLWEQARAALLGTVIARETNTAMVRRINYRRYLTPRGDEIAFQSVHRDSGIALRSFDAIHTAAEFMRRGFADPIGTRYLQFNGPDAEVLLDDALVEHYCLSLAAAQPARPTQVGLRFRPMARVRARVDIDGILWIDTLARSLTDIEYTYLGLESWATPLRPGGRIGFAETSPATIWIDRWTIRMTGAGIDSGGRELPDYTRRPVVIEGGSELSSASWPDGREWKATFGAATLRLVTRDGAPITNARVMLDSTDYGGVTDSTGRVTIDELLPGPYRLSVYDSTLAIVDTVLTASPGFTAVRGATVTASAVAPTLREFMTQECLAQEAFTERSYMLVARLAAAPDGAPMSRVKWRLETPAGVSDFNAPGGIFGHGETGDNGMVYFCKGLSEGRRVVLRVWPPGGKADGEGGAVTLTLRDRVTAVKLLIRP